MKQVLGADEPSGVLSSGAFEARANPVFVASGRTNKDDVLRRCSRPAPQAQNRRLWSFKAA